MSCAGTSGPLHELKSQLALKPAVLAAHGVRHSAFMKSPILVNDDKKTKVRYSGEWPTRIGITRYSPCSDINFDYREPSSSSSSFASSQRFDPAK